MERTVARALPQTPEICARTRVWRIPDLRHTSAISHANLKIRHPRATEKPSGHSRWSRSVPPEKASPQNVGRFADGHPKIANKEFLSDFHAQPLPLAFSAFHSRA